jgi:hypothetical protein
MMLGLCETMTILVPVGGIAFVSLRNAAARRLFSFGETTKPPSVTSMFWPLAARAQQTVMPVIGFIAAGSVERFGDRLAAFREGLRKTGFDANPGLIFSRRERRNAMRPRRRGMKPGNHTAETALRG